MQIALAIGLPTTGKDKKLGILSIIKED